MRFAFYLFFAIALFFPTAKIAANELKKDPAPAASESPEKQEPQNPYLAKADTKAKELAAAMSDEEAHHAGLVRQSFGVMRSIGVVRRNVENAVKLCGKDNPDLKDAIDARFTAWNGEIGTALKEQEKHFKKAVSADFFKKPGDVQAYLDLLDNAAGYAEEKMDKQVVTTPDACTDLQTSMDTTQKTLLELLAGLPWPGSPSAIPFEGAKSEGTESKTP